MRRCYEESIINVDIFVQVWTDDSVEMRSCSQQLITDRVVVLTGCQMEWGVA